MRGENGKGSIQWDSLIGLYKVKDGEILSNVF
jgi:hypothetical protein